MTRDSFIFYRSFKNAVRALPIEMRLNVYEAIIDYALEGIEPPQNGIERAIFEIVRPQIDANNKRYENGCKGAECGKRGGAPIGNQNARKQPQNNPKTTPNVNVNDNVNDNVHTVVCNRADAHAREAFCKAYRVADDDTTTDIDFDLLSKAYSKSTKWLQMKQYPRRLSWAVKHYAEIISGKYADFEETPPVHQTERDDVQIAKSMAADKAAECKQRLLESDPEFYENEKALRLANMQIAKGEIVPLGGLLEQRYVILSKHNLTSKDIGDDAAVSS